MVALYFCGRLSAYRFYKRHQRLYARREFVALFWSAYSIFMLLFATILLYMSLRRLTSASGLSITDFFVQGYAWQMLQWFNVLLILLLAAVVFRVYYRRLVKRELELRAVLMITCGQMIAMILFLLAYIFLFTGYAYGLNKSAPTMDFNVFLGGVLDGVFYLVQ